MKEITIELHPGTDTPEKLRQLIGFTKENQRIAGRERFLDFIMMALSVILQEKSIRMKCILGFICLSTTK